MKARLLTGLLVLAVTLGACSRQAAEEKQWEEVMAIHDEVMPKMSTINRLSRQLSDHLETTEAIPADQQQRLEAGLQQLQAADEQMWEWMNNLRQLNSLREEMDHAAIMTYLQQQKEAIDAVRGNMLAAIEAGEKLTRELPAGTGLE